MLMKLCLISQLDCVKGTLSVSTKNSLMHFIEIIICHATDIICDNPFGGSLLSLPFIGLTSITSIAAGLIPFLRE